MRVLRAFVGASILALTGCSAVPYELVCAPNAAEVLSERDCIAVAAAVVRDLDAGQGVALVTVQAFRGCPPGAYCGLRTDPPPAHLSALVGVRMSDGTSAMRLVEDAEVRPLGVTAIIGYRADRFIDGLNDAAGTRRP